MNSKIRKKTQILIMGFMVLIIMAGQAIGATYNLRATATSLNIDGIDIPMWGYALMSYDIGAGEVVVNGVPMIPGPVLAVPTGQGLIVNLTNELAVPVSIIIPGQAMPLAQGAVVPEVVRNLDGRIRSFTHETASGDTTSYIWATINPGTYLYHSGTHPAVQVQMGLYGAVTNNFDDATSAIYDGELYDSEATLLYSEIDPALHEAVDTGTYGTAAYPSTIDYKPKYLLVNGVAGGVASSIVNAPVAGDNVLIRLLNAGLKDHAPTILGTHVRVIAEDGNPYIYPEQRFSMSLPAGKTLDAILTSYAVENYPVFDHSLYQIDNAPPYIVSSIPASGAMDVPLAVNFSVTFSERMNESSVLNSTITLEELDPPGSLLGPISINDLVLLSGGQFSASFNASGDVLTLTSTSELQPNANYRVTIANILARDIAGNLLIVDEMQSTFKTVP